MEISINQATLGISLEIPRAFFLSECLINDPKGPGDKRYHAVCHTLEKDATHMPCYSASSCKTGALYCYDVQKCQLRVYEIGKVHSFDQITTDVKAGG